MIKFVNAKINIGLSVTGRRADGYHNLETIFYPVGRYNGTPENPTPFCDILETVRLEEPAYGTASEVKDIGDIVEFKGRQIDCPPDKNLVVKALRLFREECLRREIELPRFGIVLEKHLPDGAGLGGGSADASLTLISLNEEAGNPLDKDTLIGLASRLGADCPIFIENKPLFASGTGNIFEKTEVDLSGWWALIVKPDIYVSTKEAFAGIIPQDTRFDLRHLGEYPVDTWKDKVFNDFEESIFPSHPELAQIKKRLYESGAVYASMSGSGSALYGLYPSESQAIAASSFFPNDLTFLSLL